MIYDGANDASRVPAEWHGWLHHSYDELPESHLAPAKIWEADYTPNATGTLAAYRPAGRARARWPPRAGHRRLRSLVAGRLTVRALALLPPVLAALLALAACSGKAPAPEAVETEVPKELARTAPPVVAGQDSIGTPMADRVATLGLLNKRNNISQDLVMKPGESRRVGNVMVRLSACEKTAPWETDPEEGAFVQVLVQERKDASGGLRVAQGVFRLAVQERARVNVVEHPVYDVWVKACAMSFPGEEASVPSPPARSSAKPSGSDSTPAPAPSPSPATESPTA